MERQETCGPDNQTQGSACEVARSRECMRAIQNSLSGGQVRATKAKSGEAEDPSRCNGDTAGSNMDTPRKTRSRHRLYIKTLNKKSDPRSRTHRASSFPPCAQKTQRCPVRSSSCYTSDDTGGEMIRNTSSTQHYLHDYAANDDQFASDLDGIPVRETDGSERNDSTSTSQGPEDFQCILKRIEAFPTVVPKVQVRALSLHAKERLLDALKLAVNPETVLKRLWILSPSIASDFEVKTDPRERITFRLLVEDQCDINAVRSFIALSYRRGNLVRDEGHNFSLPLEPHLFEAVMTERQSSAEGLWVDQLCVDPNVPGEQESSILSIDVVYRSARAVIIVLADIQLKCTEVESLEKLRIDMEALRSQRYDSGHAQSFKGRRPPYMISHPRLRDSLEKILGSSWFRSAWCRHEMKVAREHVFLVDCVPFDEVHHVFRFTGGFMSALMELSTEVPFPAAQEQLKPELHKFFQRRSRSGPPREKDHDHQNVTTVIAEIFRMEAGGDPRLPVQQRGSDANRDRMVMVLNAAQSGLAIKSDGPDNFSGAMCLIRLMLVALACGDAGALCSVGKPLELRDAVTNTRYYSWLFEPSPVDTGANQHGPLPPMPSDAHILLQPGRYAMQSLEMDIVFPHIKEMRHPGTSSASRHVLDHAASFVQRCLKRSYGKHNDHYLVKSEDLNSRFGDMNEVYVETLACVFECGDQWLEDVCRRHKVTGYTTLSDLRVVRTALREAWWTDGTGIEAAGFLMDFVNFVVLRGMPLRQLSHYETWRPLWMDSDSGKCMTFAPRTTVRLAAPAAVRHEDYFCLARAWILQETGVADDWILRGKSVLFGDASFTQALGANTIWPSARARISGKSS